MEAVMKTQFVNELAEGTRVDAQFALQMKEMRATRSGDAYLALDLADKTCRVPAVFFRPDTEAMAIPVGAVVRARGTVTSFRGTKRISVDSLRPAGQWEPEDLLASGPRSSEELIDELRALVAAVESPDLKAIVRTVFSDKSFFERFVRCPGAQSYHHAYIGGLLEHTVSVAGLCRSVAAQYQGVDTDLLLSAALLHDIGKCDELSFDTAIEYTDEGRLMGHVVLGMRRVHNAVARLRTPRSPDRLMRLEHAILSHHGELEWGSPKRPSTIEALLLHHVDNLDAKTAGFSALLGGAVRAEESWTDSANLFRRPLYAPRAAEDERQYRADEDAQHVRLTA
jgi:3'-5' exoribonuclease